MVGRQAVFKNRTKYRHQRAAKNTVSCDTMLCSPAELYERFKRSGCSHHSGNVGRSWILWNVSTHPSRQQYSQPLPRKPQTTVISWVRLSFVTTGYYKRWSTALAFLNSTTLHCCSLSLNTVSVINFIYVHLAQK